MKEWLDGDDLFVDVMMMRQVDSRLVVVVEGSDDVGVIDPHLNPKSCRVEPGYGKPSVLRLAKLVKDQALIGVFVVVDRDFDADDVFDPYRPNISVSKHYDLMMDILFSCKSILHQLIANFGNRETIETWASDGEFDVLTMLVRHSAAIGALRRVSSSANLGLHLAKFPVHTVIDAEEAGMLVEHLSALAIQRTKNCIHDIANLQVLVREVLETSNHTYLCSSHDFVSILAAFLRLRWGGRVAMNGADMLSRAARSAVSCECLMKLPLYNELAVWAQVHGETAWTCAA